MTRPGCCSSCPRGWVRAGCPPSRRTRPGRRRSRPSPRCGRRRRAATSRSRRRPTSPTAGSPGPSTMGRDGSVRVGDRTFERYVSRSGTQLSYVERGRPDPTTLVVTATTAEDGQGLRGGSARGDAGLLTARRRSEEGRARSLPTHLTSRIGRPPSSVQPRRTRGGAPARSGRFVALGRGALTGAGGRFGSALDLGLGAVEPARAVGGQGLAATPQAHGVLEGRLPRLDWPRWR